MLLLHNVVQGRARGITEVLQQRAVALVAERAELPAATRRSPAGGGVTALLDNLFCPGSATCWSSAARSWA
jgi:hypothetical protein